MLHLLRHGAPVEPGLMLGRTDMAPTPAGIADCLRQARQLDVAQLISSDLLRARGPARAIGEELDIEPAIDPRWRELDFGQWEGKPAAALDQDALARFWNDPDSFPPPGGERWSALVARISAALTALTPQATLIVTHGGAMRAALHLLCGFDLPRLWTFDLPYGALLSLQVWPGAEASAQIMELRR